jgi:hypothetical protein
MRRPPVSPPPDPAAWQAWKTATFGEGYHIWHDGLGVELVTRLRGPAREHALHMLRGGLALGDDHAARALAAMDDPADAPAVRAHLESCRGAELVWLALTLHERHPEPTLARRIIAVLQAIDPGDRTGSGRLDAAMALRHFPGPDTEAALLAAVADPAYLVRYHASESLLALWHIRRADIAKHPAIFAQIRDDAGDHADARDRLRKLGRRHS